VWNTEGEIPVGLIRADLERGWASALDPTEGQLSSSSGCLRVQPEGGWYTPPKAKYRGGSPLAYKYRKGKMQRTLKREFKELEIS